MTTMLKYRIPKPFLLAGGPIISILAVVAASIYDYVFNNGQPLAVIPITPFSVLTAILFQNLNIARETENYNVHIHGLREEIKSTSSVFKVGKPKAALKYVAHRLDELHQVMNTSFTIDSSTEDANDLFYNTLEYDYFLSAIVKCCKRGLLWRDIGDLHANSRFEKIATKCAQGALERYKYRLIEHLEPQINFIILQFRDDRREVLFNWDLRKKSGEPTVLLSRDEDLISMFMVQYNELWRQASTPHDKIATKSTSTKYAPIS